MSVTHTPRHTHTHALPNSQRTAAVVPRCSASLLLAVHQRRRWTPTPQTPRVAGRPVCVVSATMYRHHPRPPTNTYTKEAHTEQSVPLDLVCCASKPGLVGGMCPHAGSDTHCYSVGCTHMCRVRVDLVHPTPPPRSPLTSRWSKREPAPLLWTGPHHLA